MDIEKLIDRLGENTDCWTDKVHGYADLRLDAATALSTLQAENEKLRAKVEQLEYERDYPCIYFKAGGLCRYGGDESEANICVMGPCDVETTAEDVDRLRAELEQVKAERDAAVSWAQKYTESIDMPCVACKHNTGDYVCTAICGNCGPMGAESCKWEFDFSGELKED